MQECSILFPSVVGSFLALAVITAPNAKGADCLNAAARYAAAVAKVTEAVRRFDACVASGERGNDCTEEFEALDEAHDDFVDAVENLKSCP